MQLVILLLTHIWLVESETVDFTNYSLISVEPRDGMGIDLEDWSLNTEILSYPSRLNRNYEVVVPPESLRSYLTVLSDNQLTFKVVNHNIQNDIDQEKEANDLLLRDGETYGWKRYYNYRETNNWLKSLPEKYPNQATIFNIGRSTNDRDTLGVKLSKRSGNKAIFIEAGTHAREWIGPATSTYILNELLTSEDPRMKSLSENFDWYIVPIVNPDGYSFTQIHRLWRKNMRRTLLCFGVDLNRNWNYHWNEAGTSTFPCSDIYSGSQGNSEVETKNLESFVKSVSKEVRLYLSFHAFSQLLLWPEGHANTRIEEYNDYNKIGKATVDAISKRYGTKYQMGSINEAIYPAAGGSIDYMRAIHKIPLSYCFELRPDRSAGALGFILPPEQIIPTGEETLDGISAMISTAEDLGYFK